MYTREEASQVRQQFWTAFGKYMAPISSAGGNKVNWSNYKTGIRHLYFRMDADKRKASIAIEIMHKEPDYAKKIYDQFLLLKSFFPEGGTHQWEWEQHTQNEHGQELSRIFMVLQPVNIFKKEDWPAIISFFKEHILALDIFWAEHKMIFETIE